MEGAQELSEMTGQGMTEYKADLKEAMLAALSDLTVRDSDYG